MENKMGGLGQSLKKGNLKGFGYYLKKSFKGA